MSIREKLLLSPLYDWFGKRSYAQAGEDIIADVVLEKKKEGVYIDVGAYHPKVFSNTYLFYKRGWSGVCIEPRPGAAAEFASVRPCDKFVGMGVAKEKDVLEYMEFFDKATSTFSKTQAEKNIKEAGRKMKRKINVAVMPLADILSSAGMEGKTIDLMSVDVEGMDLEVLKSNDWEKWRPRVLIVEDWGFNLPQPLPACRTGRFDKGGVYPYLTKLGYKLVAKTPYSLIFKDSSL